MTFGDLTYRARHLDYEVAGLNDTRPGDVDRPRAAANADTGSEIEGLNRHRGQCSTRHERSNVKR